MPPGKWEAAFRSPAFSPSTEKPQPFQKPAVLLFRLPKGPVFVRGSRSQPERQGKCFQTKNPAVGSDAEVSFGKGAPDTFEGVDETLFPFVEPQFRQPFMSVGQRKDPCPESVVQETRGQFLLQEIRRGLRNRDNASSPLSHGAVEI